MFLIDRQTEAKGGKYDYLIISDRMLLYFVQYVGLH